MNIKYIIQRKWLKGGSWRDFSEGKSREESIDKCIQGNTMSSSYQYRVIRRKDWVVYSEEIN